MPSIPQIKIGNTTYDLKDKRVNELNRALSYTINPATTARNRFLSLKDTTAIQNSAINRSGALEEQSGSGNNWVSEMIKIPSDKRDIMVIFPNAYWCAAFYDKDFSFISFYNNNNMPNISGNSLVTISVVNNAEYIRFGFYSGNGYSDEKYYNLFRAYSIVPEYKRLPFYDIAPALPWGYTSPDAQRNIITATSTIGTIGYVRFEKPVIVTAKTGYKIAASLKDPKKNGGTISEWFPNPDDGPLFIPSGVDAWIGIRPIDSNASIILPEDISEQIKIEAIDNEIEFSAPPFSDMLNGYTLFGQIINNKTSQYYLHRVCSTHFIKADEDTLFHITNQLSQFTLIIYSGNEIDYSAEGKWTAYFSRKTDIVIPAGSWYCYSAGLTVDSDELAARESYQIIPLTKTELAPMSVPFVQSLLSNLGSLGKRITALENNSVPAYYESHLTEKINTINSFFPNVTDQFIFITDIHLNGYGGNPGHSKALINRIARNTAISKVINGGDLINRPSALIDDAKTYRDTLALIEEGAEYTRPDTGIPQFIIIGNHDSGVDYDNGTKIPNTISVDEFMVHSGLNTVRPLIHPDVKSGTQYYFDYNGIRYIIINPHLRDEVPTGEGYGDSWEFLANVALLSMPAGYHAIIMPHVFLEGPNEEISGFTKTITDTADAYNSRGTATYGGLSADFSNCNGLVAAFIAGHAHQDFNKVTSGGIPIIFTTTDNGNAEISESGLERIVGTVSEQAFDVFSIDKTNRKIYATRIGAGNNRQFSY